VLRYDQRGHGETDAPPGGYTFDLLVSDVIALFDTLGVDRAHFAGCSMGGMTTLGLVEQHANRVITAAPCDTTAHSTPEMKKAWEERIAAARQNGVPSMLDSTINRWFPPETVAHAAFIPKIKEMIVNTSLNGYVGCSSALSNFSYQDGLASIKSPLLVIVGTKDQMLEGSRAIHRDVPGSKLVELEGAGHLSSVDAADGTIARWTRISAARRNDGLSVEPHVGGCSRLSSSFRPAPRAVAGCPSHRGNGEHGTRQMTCETDRSIDEILSPYSVQHFSRMYARRERQRASCARTLRNKRARAADRRRRIPRKRLQRSFRGCRNHRQPNWGIQGRPLKFVLSDTQTNPQVALQLVNGLIAKHVAVFIDGGPAGVCSASIPVVLNSGPLDYCLSPGVHPPAGSYVLSSSVSTEDLAKTLVRFFRTRVGRIWV